MSKLAFHGEGSGLGRVQKNGDANSVQNYVLTCKCDAVLGPLGRFFPDGEGRRCAACPQCLSATVVDKHGIILMVTAIANVLTAAAKVA